MIRKHSAEIEKKFMKTFNTAFMAYVNELLLSAALTFESSGFLCMPKDLKVFQNSMVYQYFLSFFFQEWLFLAVIKASVSCLAFYSIFY